MPSAIHALDCLLDAKSSPAAPIVALVGDDPFLKQLVVDRLRADVLSGEDAEFSYTVLPGAEATLSDVLDLLATVALFGGGRRLVVVGEADEFVSRYRAPLEDYAERPTASSVLVLDVKTFPSNTRLAKKVAATGRIIECTAGAAAKLRKWALHRAKHVHGRTIDAAALDLLLEIVGAEPGRLDQELAKLAAAASQDREIAPDEVRRLVAGDRVQSTWEMLDSALAGEAPKALAELDRLLSTGEHPLALMGAISFSLRRFAAAAHWIRQQEVAGSRASVREALAEAGVKPFLMAKSETQMRQLGRQRAMRLNAWLLEADLALKGQSELEPRMVLERLIARLSRAAAPSRG